MGVARCQSCGEMAELTPVRLRAGYLDVNVYLCSQCKDSSGADAFQPTPIMTYGGGCHICGALPGEQCCIAIHASLEDKAKGGSGVVMISCPCPRCSARC